MVAIETIPIEEMRRDLAESLADILICKAALAVGVTHHRDGFSVQESIDTNFKIIRAIEAELARRGERQ